MNTYSITIKASGAYMGTFEGTSPAEALAAMNRSAGYAAADAVDADGVSLCPTIDDVTITELEFEGAGILVRIDRHTIDPQGLASDEENDDCQEYILECVRDAFPGADVRAVTHGRSTGVLADGTDISDDVDHAVAQAFEGWNW
jgi:hypothetical protein